MSEPSDGEGAGRVAGGIAAAASAVQGAARLADDPVGGATDLAAGAAGVASAAGVEGAGQVQAGVQAAGSGVAAARDLAHDPVGGLLGMADAGAGVAGAAGASPAATGAIHGAASTARSVVAAAREPASSAAARASTPPPGAAAPGTGGPGASGAGSPGAVAPASQTAWGGSASSDRLHVRYAFQAEGEGGAEWRVLRVALEERLDAPYECVVDLVNDDTTADPLTLLGQSATLTVERHTPRDVHGIVRRVERGETGPSDRHVWARVTVVPALWSLSRTRNTRIFQEKTVPEILEEVLGAGLGAFQREARVELRGTYHPREYCVQWEESDLAFCHRLMQEEGIWYHFDDSGEHETMVLGDAPTSFPELDTQDGEPVPFRRLSLGSGPVEAILQLESARQLVPNKMVVREYDWTRARSSFEGEAELSGDAAATADEPALEEYVHGPVVHFSRYSEPQFEGDDAQQQASLQQRRRRTEIERASARSDLTMVSPGMVLELEGHPRPELDRRWLVIAARHEGSSPSEGGGSSGSEVEYLNHLELVPADVDWRPRRTEHKRRVHGVVTATVVGPSGEEIHTDVHGRIKVQFHWDREGERDERSSCFVRSMQPWAGPGWGFNFLPRIGMEVVVTFVDGDVDRPLVIGTVYNGANAPPYPLPEDKTRSTIKSSSTPGGDGFNELRFEDAAGHEEIFVHAQKDMNEVVLNHHTRSVGANETISVGGNRTKSVDENETITITGSQSITIEGAEQGDGHPVKGGALNITGKYKVDASEWIEIQAPQHIKLTVGNTFVLIEPDKITCQQADGARMVLSPQSAVMASKENSQALLTADAQVQASTGGDVTLTANAQVTGNSAQLLLNGEALVKSQANAELHLTADAAMKGANATVQGQTNATVTGGTEATLTAGPSTVKSGPAGVDASGPKVGIAGQGMVEVTGGIIKLN